MLMTGQPQPANGCATRLQLALAQRKPEPVERHERQQEWPRCGWARHNLLLRTTVDCRAVRGSLRRSDPSRLPAARRLPSPARPWPRRPSDRSRRSDERCGQVFFLRDAQRIVRAQAVGDGGEVGVVRPHHDRHAELRRLQRIVAARRNQAAADEGHAGQRVDRRQFADRVEQDNLRRAAASSARLRRSNPTAASRLCPTSRAAQRPRQIAQDGAGQGPSRVADRRPASLGHASSSAASSPSSVLPATTNRKPPPDAFKSRVASASCAARTSNLRLPATETRSGAQPSASSRSASVSLCASTRLRPTQQRPPQRTQLPVARPGAVGDARVHHRDRNSAAEAAVQQIRPELRLRQDQHARLERVKIRAHGPRQIERAVEDAIRAEALAGQRLAGARGGGDRDENTPAAPYSSALTSRVTARTSPTETA